MKNGAFFLFLLLVFTFISVLQSAYVTNKYEEDNPKCPLGPVVTATICGYLGNVIWDVASILALARLLPGGFQPFIRKYHYKYASRYFQKPLLPLIEDIPLNCSCWNNYNLTETNYGSVLGYYGDEYARQWKGRDNIILRSPSLSGEAIMHEIDYIKKRLRLKTELIEKANRILTKAANLFLKQENLTDDQQLTFVGVHVRRTDYFKLLNDSEIVDARFFNFGFDYFRNRKRFGKCLFIVSSDDPEWVKENLIANKTNTDVFLVGNGIFFNPGIDFAILTLVNHTIFDYGSFGLWGAVFAGGEVVTTSSYPKGHKFMQYKRFHFFDPVPDQELLQVNIYKKPID